MSKDPLNVLIIHADQHRHDCIGAYGNKDIKTPNIDKLSGDGVLYKNSFCTFPACTPSRYSFFSSLYVHQHMGWNNYCTLPPGLETFPRMMKDNGFRTKAVGKMHFTPTYSDIGFSELVLAEQDGPGRYDDDYHRYLMSKNHNDYIDLMDQVAEYRKDATDEYWESFGALPSDHKEVDHSTTWIADRAIESIEAWEGGNNLLMVGFIKPHHPFDPPSEWSDMYEPSDLTLLPGWSKECLSHDLEKRGGYFSHEALSEESLREVMANYYASISQIDYHIGRMTDLLKEKGIYDNTMIIYTSDHGDYMGYHHMLLKGNYMYDPLMKVPLIIKYPDNIHGGTECDSLISNIDIGPTILDCANLNRGKFMCGNSILRQTPKREFVFGESGRGKDYFIRSERYKLLLNKDDGKSLFFDLADDKFEMNNLYNNPEYQELIGKFKERINKWILFDCPPPIYLDEDSQIIDSENALKHDSGHRKNIKEYYMKKMKSEHL
jgi:arylsulfatase A-like enzyme